MFKGIVSVDIVYVTFKMYNPFFCEIASSNVLNEENTVQSSKVCTYYFKEQKTIKNKTFVFYQSETKLLRLL